MYFVIVGYGRVGSRTARILHEEGHDVVVVEVDAAKADRARAIGLEVVTGDGSDEDVLLDAGVARADAVGGLTGDPNVNFAACTLAAARNCRTVMRVSEDFREEVYEKFVENVDEVVYPERFGAAGAKTALLGGNFNALGDLTEGLQLSVVAVPADAPVVGERVAEVDLGSAGRIYAHGRDREPMTIPLPGTTISADDQLALIAERSRLDEVRRTLLGDAESATG